MKRGERKSSGKKTGGMERRRNRIKEKKLDFIHILSGDASGNIREGEENGTSGKLHIVWTRDRCNVLPLC